MSSSSGGSREEKLLIGLLSFLAGALLVGILGGFSQITKRRRKIK